MSAAKYYLNANVFSNCTGSVHAIMGTEVRLLSALDDHVNVVTVEDADGYRFPVSISKLSAEPVIIDDAGPLYRILETINNHKESFLYH